MVMAPPSENTNGLHRIEQAAEKHAMTDVYSAYYLPHVRSHHTTLRGSTKGKGAQCGGIVNRSGTGPSFRDSYQCRQSGSKLRTAAE